MHCKYNIFILLNYDILLLNIMYTSMQALNTIQFLIFLPCVSHIPSDVLRSNEHTTHCLNKLIILKIDIVYVSF